MDKPRLSSKKKRGRSKSRAKSEKARQTQTQSQKLIVNIGRNTTQRRTRSSGSSMTPAPYSQNLVPFHIQTAPAQQPLVDYDRIARMTGSLQEQNVPNRSIPLQEHVPVSVPVSNVEPRRDGPTSAGFELTPSEARVKQEPVVVPKPVKKFRLEPKPEETGVIIQPIPKKPIVEALGRGAIPSKPKEPLKQKIERKLMTGQDFPAPEVAVSKPVHVAPPVKVLPPTQSLLEAREGITTLREYSGQKLVFKVKESEPQALLEAREAISMVKQALPSSTSSVTTSLGATSGETSFGAEADPEQDLGGFLSPFGTVKPQPKEKKGPGRPKGAKNKPKPIKT